MSLSLSQQYHATQARLQQTCFNAGIHYPVHLLAVSKTRSIDEVQTCYQLGQRAFGENYLQDALPKIQALAHLKDIQWHFIGPLQSNKSKAVAEHFHWLETLSRIKIAERLNRQRPRYLPPLNVLVQINISGEAQKDGIAPAEAEDFCAQLQTFKWLKLRGLMCIGEHTFEQAKLSQQYQQMAALFQQLSKQYPDFNRLSMGMSQDMEIAIAQGSNEVRIGTDIFGKRS